MKRARKILIACTVGMIAAVILVFMSAGGVYPMPPLPRFVSVQLTNKDIAEGVSITSCFGPDAARTGPMWIPFRGFQYLRFEVDSLSEGWWCNFEYTSTADGAVHSADVLVWHGVLSSKRADVTEMAFVNVVPCVWRVQRDGFYRARDTNHQEFQLMAVWHQLEHGSEGASLIERAKPVDGRLAQA